MAQDLLTLVQELQDDGRFQTIFKNPLAQFGDPNQRRPFLGAQLLPEMQKSKNLYEEAAVQFLSTIANDGTPFAPPKLQRSIKRGSTLVKFGHIDVKTELTGEDLEAIIQMLESGENSNQQLAQNQLLTWMDRSVNLSLKIKQEKQRWQAIVDASVPRKLGDGSTETVTYAAPSGHRFNATGTWSNDSFDPFTDIIAAWNLLWDLGYDVAHNITSNTVASKLGLNDKVRTRAGYLGIDNSGVVQTTSLGVGLGLANEALRRGTMADREIPLIQTYDLNYETQDGSRDFFLPRDCFVVVGTTGQRREVLANDELFYLENTLGYYGIGRVEGYTESGTIVKTEVRDRKPRAVCAEAYVTGLPVIFSRNMEAIVVIENIS
jgi:hypothetical protein